MVKREIQELGIEPIKFAKGGDFKSDNWNLIHISTTGIKILTTEISKKRNAFRLKAKI